MVLTSGGSSTGRHSGRRNNSGRKKIYDSGSSRKGGWEKCRQRIRLEQNIYKSWLEAKFEAGYGSSSDSDFATHFSVEFPRRKTFDHTGGIEKNASKAPVISTY